MWLPEQQTRKWRPDSLEARIYAIAEAEALANGIEDPAGAAIEAVFEVLSWLYSRSGSAVSDMVKEQFGVETSAAALSGFWKRFAGPWLMERNRRNAAMAQVIAQESNLGALTDATMEMVAQQALELLSSPSPDGRRVVGLAKLLVSAQKQGIEERKIKLLEAKAAQADEARGVLGDGDLSQEEKEKRMRSIFGM